MSLSSNCSIRLIFLTFPPCLISWKAPQLDAASYSTGQLVRNDLKMITPLPKGQQIRTLVSQEQRQEASEKSVIMIQSKSQHLDIFHSKFEQRLLRWSVLACEELLRSQKELESRNQDEETSREKEEEGQRFDIQSSEMLILFQDYLSGLQVDASFDPVSLNPEEMTTLKVRKKVEVSLDEVYRIARIHVTLIHHFWTLYLTPVATDTISTPKQDPISGQLDIVSQKEMKAQLDRIEESSKKAEWGLSELLLRKFPSSQQQGYHTTNEWQCRVPYLGLADARIFIALIVGILMGTMTARV